MKKRISMALAIILSLSMALTGCGKKNETTLSGTDTDIYCKVVSIDGTTVEVNVVSMPDMSQKGGMEMPTGEAGNMEIPTNSDGQINMSEMPQGGDGNMNMPQGGGDGQGTMPEMPTGADGQINMSEMPQGGGDGQGTPPEMPTGENGTMETPPEMPTGEDGTMEMPQDGGSMLTTTGESGTVSVNDASVLFKLVDGEETSASIGDMAVGKILKISFNESGEIEKIVIYNENELFMGGGAGGGQGSAPTDYDAVKKVSEDTSFSKETLDSTGTDENDLWVSGGTVTLDDVTVTRTSADSTGGDNSSFYGVGAAILATDGTVNISNSKITTDAAGGAGVFAYGNAVVSVSDTTISTKQNTSGGIHAAGGGTLYANNLTVDTAGESAAAIRSDRGGGTMVVNGGTYTSNGTGSPAIYCTADISVKDSTLTSTNSEAICIEGKNSLKLYNCQLTGNMPDLDANDCTWTVIVYQSMSGDAEIGTGTFQMTGGTLVSKNGGLFYTTNTTSNIILDSVSIEPADDFEFLLACLGNANSRGWGTTGKNGADCTFTAINQTLGGKVLWDSVSTLNFYLTEKTLWTGSIADDEAYAGAGGDGYASLYIDSSSKWIVDGNSTVTNLYCAGSIVDTNGKTVSVVGTDGTKYVEGTGEFTITVSAFSKEADVSGAGSPTKESDVDFH